MPFICLANTSIPDGVLQITDLWPNVSQDNNPTNPPGQTRYLRRPGQDIPAIDPLTGLVAGSPADSNKQVFDGLGAYLVDRVEIGADSVAEATVTLATVVATNQIVIKGIYFEFAAGANDLVKLGTVGDPIIVGLGADDDAAAANLTIALNDAGVAAIVDVPATANLHTVAANPGAPSAVVVIQAETGAAALVTGPTGEFSITTSDGATMVLDAASLAAGTFARAYSTWDTATVTAAVAAVQNLVDSGLAATIAAVDGVLAGWDADLSGATVAGSTSTGTLTELLWVFSGRTYRIAKGASKFTGTTWDATQLGSFTEAVSTFDTDMLGGEWGPTASGPWIKRGPNKAPTVTGGDAVNREFAGARGTVSSTAFQASLTTGQLSQYTGGVTLFPDAAVQAHLAPTLHSKQTRQATLLNQRVVTVYGDDGTLLA